MAQVVKMVEEALRQAPSARPSVVRLKVSTQSHFFEHDAAALQSVFAAAAEGTIAERAVLEILPVPVTGHCRLCGTACEMKELLQCCPGCGAANLDAEPVPDVVLYEVVVEGDDPGVQTEG
ncbi:MAG: hydrogenase maturation nickel metallochaperone HypA [Gallionella sp.]|nr:hydrogenase maturation nickel metallochaperone HypA [Gallionella sp.]